ncbi:MAG: transcription repressor NadR [Ruthenibacterium sp.]
MTAAERRIQIQKILTDATQPLSASALAQTLGVSRQLVVGDVALLRAGGVPIVATPRGYMTEHPKEDGILCTVACRHTAAQIADELYTMVDCGCRVVDVIVEHPVYGQLLGQLQISSRYDADLFCKALAENAAEPLCRLTGDIHLHTVSCPTPEHQVRMLAALDAKQYLVKTR